MWPSFSAFDYLTIPTLPLFLFAAAFFGGFVFWRLLHQSARYNEFQVFDAVCWSIVAGVIGGRAFHLLLHPTLVWPEWSHSLDLVNYPGISVFFSLLTASVCFWGYLHRLKITDLELLDYWVRGCCLALVIYNIGLFAAGTGSGFLSSSWLAIQFPGTDFTVFPAQLVATGFFTLIYFLLGYLEKNYRTYTWYRGTRSQAKTGFVLYTFFACLALFQLLSLCWQPARYHFRHISLDWIFYLVFLLLTAILFAAHTWSRPRNNRSNKKSPRTRS